MAGGTFPTTVPSYPTLGASETLGTAGAGVGHRTTHINEEADVTALATKLGIGSSTPGVGQVLACPTTAGTTAWTGSMLRISRTVLGGTTATVDFTSIPQGFSDLRITVLARSTVAGTNDAILMRLGSSGTLNTGSNYDWVGLYGSAAAASYTTEGAVAATSATVGYAVGSTGPSNEVGKIVIEIPSYAATTFNKGWTAHAAYRTSTTTASTFVETFGGDLRATTAVDTIRLLLGSGSFAAGSAFELWGVL